MFVFLPLVEKHKLSLDTTARVAVALLGLLRELFLTRNIRPLTE